MGTRWRARTLQSLMVALLLATATPIGVVAAEDAAVTTTGARASCSLASSTNFCDDFNSGRANRWSTEGAIWRVVNRRYVGTPTFDSSPSPCGHPTGQSLIRGVRARNLDMRVDLTSLTGVDKFVVLRSTDSDNQIELNFRAAPWGDLVVQEKTACAFFLHTPEFSVLIPPHQVGQTIRTRIRLIGDRLTIWIDGSRVLDRTFPFTARAGRAGVGVWTGKVGFDNVRVSVL
jgi:hypothetical protein